MTEHAPNRGHDGSPADHVRPLDSQTSILESYYAQSQAGRWGLARERFAAALERSSKKAFTVGTVTPQKLEHYLDALHLEDLPLAAPCAHGIEPPCHHFSNTYLPH